MTASDGDPPHIDGLTYVRKIGQGGYADVFLYQQAVPLRRVAVKVLRDAGLTDTVRARFETEANTMAMLQGHPNIVSVFDVGTTSDQRPYITMQHYPGATLADGRRHPVADVLRIGINIASAIETAHRAGLLHRDIKPHNILTDQWQAPALTDFGIAAQLADADDDVGVSVPWSPPEVLFGTAPPSMQSDVYSLAATLWHLLAGRSPFEVAGDNSDNALMMRIRDADPQPTGRPDVPASLERLLQLAMAKNPAHRPQSAMDFARWLQAIEQELRLPPTRIDVAELSPSDQPLADSRTLPVGRDARSAPPAEATRVRTPHGAPSAPPPAADSAAPIDAPPALIGRPEPAAVIGDGGFDHERTDGARHPSSAAMGGPPSSADAASEAGFGTAVSGHGAGFAQDQAAQVPSVEESPPRNRSDPDADRPLLVSDDPSVRIDPRVPAPGEEAFLPSSTTAATAADADSGSTDAPPRHTVRILVAALVFLVLLTLAFLGGALAARGGATAGRIATGPTGSAVFPPAMDAPGAVAVHFQRTDNTVAVTWTYPQQLASDYVRFRVNAGKESTTSEKTILVTTKERVCIQIVPVRETGQYPWDGEWPRERCET